MPPTRSIGTWLPYVTSRNGVLLGYYAICNDKRVYGFAGGLVEDRETRHSVRILLADDETSLRLMLARVLNRQGWEVTEVADGQSAIDAWPEGGEPYDIVILDVQMPDLNGAQVYDVLSQRRPLAHFVFITGYMGWQPWEQIVASNMPTLLKPFKPAELVAKIWEMLRTPHPDD
jgi:CheY-like chemotaxis protein